MWLVLAGCHAEPEKEAPRDPVLPPDAFACEENPSAPFLDAALTDAGTTRDGFTMAAPDWEHWELPELVEGDDFLLPWFHAVKSRPLDVACHGSTIAHTLDTAVTSEHPVASAIGEAMALLGEPQVGPPIDPATATQTLADLSSLDPDLADALVPILVAISRVADARAAAFATAFEPLPALVKHGHGWTLWDEPLVPDLYGRPQREWVIHDVRPTFDAARVLALAVEDADLARFAGQEGTLDVTTALGRVIVAGPGADAPGEIGEVALYVDLGGDDTYVHAVGASGVDVPAGVHVDLGGNDTYGYVAIDAGTDAVLPADGHGRCIRTDCTGPRSLSQQGRQGSGRFGAGLLWDLGGGDDRYTSLRASQGWGALGVGALYDDGGDDRYHGESGVQGAGAMGIGLLVDRDGHDDYRTFTNAQGYGGPHGIGIAWDGSGDDRWWADPGADAEGGTTLYGTGQLENGNDSQVQGAGFGLQEWVAGGFGVLRDVGGDDAYTAGVFGQGFGYWEGTGYLLEGGGADTYDGLWRTAADAVHIGLGALLDDGPEDDRFGTVIPPVRYGLGDASDYSVAVLVNEGGNDTYTLGDYVGGVGTCQGLGLFVDNDGADTYLAGSFYVAGMGDDTLVLDGNACAGDPVRLESASGALFLDAGGDPDAWSWPLGGVRPSPTDDAAFGWAVHGAPDEYGGAIDGDGETGVHAGVAPR